MSEFAQIVEEWPILATFPLFLGSDKHSNKQEQKSLSPKQPLQQRWRQQQLLMKFILMRNGCGTTFVQWGHLSLSLSLSLSFALLLLMIPENSTVFPLAQVLLLWTYQTWSSG